MAALEILRPVIDLDGKRVIPLPSAMSRDLQARETAHRAMIKDILSCLAEGLDVAMVNLGDVSLYATAAYLTAPVRQAGYTAEWIPGVTSFSAASAALGAALAEGDTPLHIIPCLTDGWRAALDLPGTKVLMKPGDRLPEIFEFLRQTGRQSRAALVINCGMEGEALIAPFDRLPEKRSYFSLVIIKEGQTW